MFDLNVGKKVKLQFQSSLSICEVFLNRNIQKNVAGEWQGKIKKYGAIFISVYIVLSYIYIKTEVGRIDNCPVLARQILFLLTELDIFEYKRILFT